jgi:hypothetical protein
MTIISETDMEATLTLVVGRVQIRGDSRAPWSVRGNACVNLEPKSA